MPVRDTPLLGGGVVQAGVADEAGNVMSDPSTEATAGIQAFGAGVADFVAHGVWNGAFQVGPPDPAAHLDADNNPLPYWTGPTVVDGSAITAMWVADADSPSGHNLRFTISDSGTASDEVYFEQIVSIGGSRTRTVDDYVRATFLSGSTANFGTRVSAQYLTADGTTTGMPAEQTTSTASHPASSLGYAQVLAGGDANASVPGSAHHLRIRLAVFRSTAATSVSGTMDFTDVRRDPARVNVLVGQQTGGSVYGPATLTAGTGTLVIVPTSTTGLSAPSIALSAATGDISISSLTGNVNITGILSADQVSFVKLLLLTTRTSTATALADVSGLTYALPAGLTTLGFRAWGFYESVAVTTGVNISINAGGGTLRARRVIETVVAATYDTARIATLDGGTATTLVDVTDVDRSFEIEGTLTNPTGTFALRFASEVGASQVSIRQGSRVELWFA